MSYPSRLCVGACYIGAMLAVVVMPASAAFAAGPDVQARLVPPAKLTAGATGLVVVEMTLGKGWHVNSHTPKQSYLIPTTVTLTTSSGTYSPIRYPGHIEKRFEFSDEPVAVYEKTVRFEALLTLPDSLKGEVALGGILSYQACDEYTCYPPAKIKLSATFIAGKEKACAR